VNLIELLERQGTEITAEASDALTRARLPHYAESGAQENLRRISELFGLTVQCIRSRDLVPMLEHARTVARERFRDGFDLREVHSAFNVLEEVLWKRITAGVAPPEYPEAFGLTSTVLGAGKQALALEYLALATQKPRDVSLDRSDQFTGV
jgi:hypothetical protein